MGFFLKEERVKEGVTIFFDISSGTVSANYSPCQKSSDNYLSHNYPPLISEYNAIS